MFPRKDWVGNVKHKDSFGCSDHEMLNFKTFRAVRSVHSKRILEFRRAGFVLFWDLLSSQEKPGRTEESKKIS